jgi:hypothetical protein
MLQKINNPKEAHETLSKVIPDSFPILILSNVKISFKAKLISCLP